MQTEKDERIVITGVFYGNLILKALLSTVIAIFIFTILSTPLLMSRKGFWNLFLIVISTECILLVVAFLLYLAFGAHEMTVTDRRIYGQAMWGKAVNLPLTKVTPRSIRKAFKGIGIATSSGYVRFVLMKNEAEVLQAIEGLLISSAV